MHIYDGGNMTTMSIDECYELLAEEIISQAARDYAHFWEIRDYAMVSAIERFFRSALFDILSNGELDAEWLIAELQKRGRFKVIPRKW